MQKTCKKLVFIALLLAVITVNAQWRDTIFMSPKAKDDVYKKTKAILAVFKFQGNPIEEYTRFGAKADDLNKFNCVLPNMNGVKDTSYGYLYFGAAGNNASPGYMLVVLGQNKRDGKPTLLWIDRNNNLDLSDDGKPDTFYHGQKYKDIKLVNPKNKNAVYEVRISRFPLAKEQTYKFMLDRHYARNSGTKKFARANYCFKQQRLNVSRAVVRYKNDSFAIGLKDINCNGIYTDAQDLLLLGNTRELLPIKGALPINETQNFERNYSKFDIEKIDKYGRYIIITSADSKLKNALRIGKKVPCIKFCTATKPTKHLKIRKFKRQYVYLYFWNSKQPNFKQDTIELRKLAESMGNKIKIIALNRGNKVSSTYKYNMVKKPPFIVGFSTTKIDKKYFVEGYPTGFLMDKRQKLIGRKISPQEVLPLLNQLNIQN